MVSKLSLVAQLVTSGLETTGVSHQGQCPEPLRHSCDRDKGDNYSTKQQHVESLCPPRPKIIRPWDLPLRISYYGENIVLSEGKARPSDI